MCKFIGISQYGPTNLLRYHLHNRIAELKRDDKALCLSASSNLIDDTSRRIEFSISCRAQECMRSPRYILSWNQREARGGFERVVVSVPGFKGSSLSFNAMLSLTGSYWSPNPV